VARNGKFVIKRGRGGETHFRAAREQSPGGGRQRDVRVEESCFKGIAAVKRVAADASVIEEDAPGATTARKTTATVR
jgi:hypothetical protein